VTAVVDDQERGPIVGRVEPIVVVRELPHAEAEEEATRVDRHARIVRDQHELPPRVGAHEVEKIQGGVIGNEHGSHVVARGQEGIDPTGECPQRLRIEAQRSLSELSAHAPRCGGAADPLPNPVRLK